MSTLTRPSPRRGLLRQEDRGDLVVTIDSDSAPRILFSGEDLLLEDLPLGTRVIYPKAPIAGLPNVRAAVRYAINHPEGSEMSSRQMVTFMPGSSRAWTISCKRAPRSANTVSRP